MKFSMVRTAHCALAVSMLFLTSGSVRGAQLSSPKSESLARMAAISDDIGGIEVSRVTYSPSQKSISVILLPGRMGSGGVTVRPLEKLTVQAWIWKRNGTTVPSKRPSSPSSQTVGFLFDDMPDAE